MLGLFVKYYKFICYLECLEIKHLSIQTIYTKTRLELHYRIFFLQSFIKIKHILKKKTLFIIHYLVHYIFKLY